MHYCHIATIPLFLHRFTILLQNGSALGAAKPFNFDEWCREIHQHPAFMTELTEADDGECSDAVRALKAMKLEDEEERAETVRKMKAIREKLARRREGEEKLQAQRVMEERGSEDRLAV